jgi:hypothetical protein
MNDRVATSDPLIEAAADEATESPHSVPSVGIPGAEQAPAVMPPDAPAATLEDRIRHLEDKVANLEDTRRLEERITERLARRIERKQANTAIKAPVASIAEPPKPPPLAVAAPPEHPPVIVLEGKAAQRPWLIVDIFTEFRAMLRMFLDGRYRLFYMTWQTKVYPPLLLGCLIVSSWMVSSIPLVGTILDKVVVLILAFFLYKVLSREAARYREISPHIRGAGYR